VQLSRPDVFEAGIGRGNEFMVKYGLFGPAIADGDWYRIITGAFLHANILHLLLNMYALYVLGPIVERSLGGVRYVIVYAAALLAGSAGALILDPNALTVGASGAIYGLMGALVVLFRNRGISLMQSGLALTLFINFVFTLSISNISIGGHVGGFVGGALATLVVVEGPRYVRSRDALVWMAGALVPIFFVVGMLAAANT
jgi:membrane associated rhomboid family serine protease